MASWRHPCLFAVRTQLVAGWLQVETRAAACLAWFCRQACFYSMPLGVKPWPPSQEKPRQGSGCLRGRGNARDLDQPPTCEQVAEGSQGPPRDRGLPCSREALGLTRFLVSGSGPGTGGQQVPVLRTSALHLRAQSQGVVQPGPLVHSAQGLLTQHALDHPGAPDLVSVVLPSAPGFLGDHSLATRLRGMLLRVGLGSQHTSLLLLKNTYMRRPWWGTTLSSR